MNMIITSATLLLQILLLYLISRHFSYVQLHLALLGFRITASKVQHFC